MQQWIKDFETFCILYNSLSVFINKLSLPPHLQKLILDEFDTGYLWVKESLTVIMPQVIKSSEAANALNPPPNVIGPSSEIVNPEEDSAKVEDPNKVE